MTLAQAVASAPSDFYGKVFQPVAITLIVMGVGYIARQAHTIVQQTGKVYRTLFGEDGNAGLQLTVRQHTDHLEDHEGRIIRAEQTLKLPRSRVGDA